MNIAVVKERQKNEKRVALTPGVVKLLIKLGFTCSIESNAGMEAGFTNQAYETVGAAIVDDKIKLLNQTDVLLKVNAPTVDEIGLLNPGTSCISFLYAYTVPEIVKALIARQISAYSMDAVPRISRAQKMDALSSQANLAGYKAVILAANSLGKIFPLMMTAAGTITPARVLIFGAGVAGLQAVATAIANRRAGLRPPPGSGAKA